MLRLNDTAPAWTGKDQTGIEHSSADYAGRFLLLYFYPKDDTPGCTAEACGFRDSFAALKDRVVIVGVSADSVESHGKFATKYSLPFMLIADPEKKIISAYGVGTDYPKRVSFLINASGIIEKIYAGFDAAKHASEVDADVKEMGI